MAKIILRNAGNSSTTTMDSQPPTVNSGCFQMVVDSFRHSLRVAPELRLPRWRFGVTAVSGRVGVREGECGAEDRYRPVL